MKNYFSVSAKMEEVFCERKNEANEKRKNFATIFELERRNRKPKNVWKLSITYLHKYYCTPHNSKRGLEGLFTTPSPPAVVHTDCEGEAEA